MKIISIHRKQKLERLIPQLKNGETSAQKELFERFSPKMLSVCRSYVKDLHHAEDCMLKAFVKVFKNINSFESNGSFEGWIRRIMVNECLDFLKLRKDEIYIDEFFHEDQSTEDIQSDYYFDAQELLDQLPSIYRVVFNLYVLEDYSHKEIAKTLEISESASKTQLLRAKRKLKEILIQQNRKINEN